MTTPVFNPSLTERDAAGAIEVLSTVSDDAEVLAVLTDEELLGLGGVQSVELTGTPYLDSAEIDKQVVANTALRSLIARGLILINPELQENEGENLIDSTDGSRPYQLDRKLSGIMTLRRSPSAMLTVNRQVSEQTTALFYYVTANDGILEEFVGADGYHHFSVPSRASVPERIARYVDQNDVAGDESGEPVETTVEALSGEGELAQKLGEDVRAMSVLTTVTQDEAAQHSVLATSDAVFIMDGPEDGLTEVTIQEFSKQTLREALAELLPASESIA